MRRINGNRCILIALSLAVLLLTIPAQAKENTKSYEIQKCIENQSIAHQMAECARKLGYPEDCEIIRTAQQRWKQEKQKEMELQSSKSYTEEDLYWLSRIISAEAGCTWIPDWVQIAVGSVVLNRVNSPLYPNTIKDVIFQPGQYGPAWSGMIYYEPQSRCVENAKYLLENGSQIPNNVFGQSGETWGKEIYAIYYDSVLGTTMYFTYN